MGKIKISDMDRSTTLKGFSTIGTDANNQSVQVSLEFVGEEADRAKTNADAAAAATTKAETATTNANNATTAAKTATTNAETATSNANTATSKANTAASNADAATANAKTATANAETATANAEKVNATLGSDNVFTVTSRDGTQKTLDLASPADVADLKERFKSYVRLRFNIDKTITVDGVSVTCPAGKIVKVYGKSISGIGSSSGTYAPQLEWADMSRLDTHGLARIPYFMRETLLKQLDVSGWDTSSVTDMGYCFGVCTSLTALDVSGWDTSKVTSMNYTFGTCPSLTALDVSGWDTSSVYYMQYMFYSCSSLTSLDVSGWDTSSVTRMGAMFNCCQKLASLDVSGWDTSNVTGMGSMFNGCSSLTSLDVSGWDTSNVTSINAMFNDCQKLASLKFGSGWGTQTSTEANALTLDLSYLNSSGSYQLSDETWSSMLTMHDRATAGLTAMTIKIKKTANIPDGWETQMAALGYTITKV